MAVALTVAALRGKVALWSLTVSLAAALLIVATTCSMPSGAPNVDPVPVHKVPDSLRVVSLNVLRWCETDAIRRARMSRWLQVQQPDVVALQELNGCSADSFVMDARQWGHEHSVFLPSRGDPLGLTSSAPITDVVMIRDGFYYGLLEGTTHGMRFFVVHLHPWDYRTRQNEVALLLERAAAHIDKGVEVVLIGDFNAPSPVDRAMHEDGRLRSHTARGDMWVGVSNLNGGELDYQAMRQLENSPLVDLAAIFQKRPQQRITFPTPLDHNVTGPAADPQRRLDYVFVTRSLANRAIRAGVVIDESTHWLSDHYPLLADFRRQ